MSLNFYSILQFRNSSKTLDIFGVKNCTKTDFGGLLEPCAPIEPQNGSGPFGGSTLISTYPVVKLLLSYLSGLTFAWLVRCDPWDFPGGQIGKPTQLQSGTNFIEVELSLLLQRDHFFHKNFSLRSSSSLSLIKKVFLLTTKSLFDFCFHQRKSLSKR